MLRRIRAAGASMLLNDSKLRFARELIGHWTQIRRGNLVPLEEDIDPRELVRLFPWLTIADLSEPETATIEVAGAAVTRRFATDIRKANWIDFMPPAMRRPAAMARDLLITVPCGIYYRYQLSDSGGPLLAAETVAVPLRTRESPRPNAVVALTHDLLHRSPVPLVSGEGRKMDEFHAEFVDIGAGAPGAFPTERP
jgi:hypothetical protein